MLKTKPESLWEHGPDTDENSRLTRIKEIFNDTIQEYIDEPIDLLDTGGYTQNETKYIFTCGASYARTITDIVSYLYKNGFYDFSKIRVLEIGSFLGVVAVTLSKLGFNVSAMDIPEFMCSKRLQEKYEKNNVKWFSSNLKDYKIPCESDKYDLIIMCEVLEHLNFNPLPVIAEVNRILRNDGILYLALPNLNRLRNRMNMLLGRSIHEPIDSFFAQLNKKDTMIVGIHWREYTTDEIKYMLEKLGFESMKSYLSSDTAFSLKPSFRSIAKKVIFSIMPSLSFHQVHIFRKIERPPDHLLLLLKQ